MAGKLKTEREQLEAELIRIDRTLAIDRKELARIKALIDELTDYRLTIESRLALMDQPKTTKNGD
jgi:hypothetical protein